MAIPGLENAFGYVDPTQDDPGYTHTNIAPDMGQNAPAPKPSPPPAPAVPGHADAYAQQLHESEAAKLDTTGKAGGRYSPDVERWRPLVEKYFKPEDVDKALYVINGESGGNPNAPGDGGHAIGLFQHNDGGLASGRDLKALADPEANIKLASEAVYGGQGWKPWGEGALYQGKPFGALGRNPYPGTSGGTYQPFNLSANGGQGADVSGAPAQTSGAQGHITPSLEELAQAAPTPATPDPSKDALLSQGELDAQGSTAKAPTALEQVRAYLDTIPEVDVRANMMTTFQDNAAKNGPDQALADFRGQFKDLQHGGVTAVGPLAPTSPESTFVDKTVPHYGPTFALGAAVTGLNPAGGAAAVAAQVASEQASKQLPANTPDPIRRTVELAPYFATPGGKFNLAKRGVELAASVGAGQVAKRIAPLIGIDPEKAQMGAEFIAPGGVAAVEGLAGRGEGTIARIASEGDNAKPTEPTGLFGETAAHAGTPPEAAPSQLPETANTAPPSEPAVATPPTPPPGEPPAPPASTPPEGGGTPRPPSSVASTEAAAGDTLQRLFGVKVPDAGLTPADKAVNWLKDTVGIGVQEEHQATPIMRERAQAHQVIESQANRTASVTSRLVKDNFDLDAAGRIKNLPGQPTIQDLAANLPAFEHTLTPGQRAAMEQLRAEAEKYHRAFVEQGLEVGSRSDVKPGGFYLPRGRADIEGADAPIAPSRGGRGGRAGSEKVATFDSMAQGIEAGYKYVPVSEAMKSYAQEVGNRALDAFTANTFKGLTDEAGNTMASTAADRINPQLRDQVEKLRAQIANKLDTFSRQNVRAGAASTHEVRMTRLADTIEAKLAAARDSLGNKLEAGSTEARIQKAELQLAAAEREARDVGPISEAQREAQQGTGYAVAATRQSVTETLNEAFNRLQSIAAELKAADRIGLSGDKTALSNDQYGHIRDLLRETIDSVKEPLSAGAVSVRAVGAAVTPKLTALSRALEQRISIAERNLEATHLAGSTDAELAKAKSQVRGLDRIRDLVQRVADAETTRTAVAQAKPAETADDIQQLRAQLDSIKGDWERAKRIAAQTPRGQGSIDLPGLQSYSFPDAVANAANKVLQSEGPPRGAGSLLLAVPKALNNLLRGLKASADLSFMGVQGLLGAAHDPVAYAKALGVALKSLRDGDTLGSYIQHFDERAASTGKPTSEQWISSGLRLGGPDTEYAIGKGLPGVAQRIQNAPIIKQSNVSFGSFGDALRLELADSIYGAGDRDLKDLAHSANLITGWSRNTFAGGAGNLLQFAPRFFESQLELLTHAATDTGTVGTEARQSLIKLVGIGSLLTVAANEALGNPVGGTFNWWSPEVNGHENPNFMRIRALGQDASLFGPWDSLYKAFAAAAHNDFTYIARTKGSPIVSTAWDLISGKTFTGKDVGGVNVGGLGKSGNLEYWLRNILPFSVSNAGQQPTLTTAVGVLGTKTSPETATELRDDARNETAQQLFPGKNYTDLLPTQRAQVDADPKVADLAAKQLATQAGNFSGQYHAAKDAAFAPIQAEAKRNEDLFNQGQNDKKLSDVYHDEGIASRQAAHDLEGQFAQQFAGFNKTKYDQAVEGYYSTEKHIPDGLPGAGGSDFDATAAARADFLKTLPADQQLWVTDSLQLTEQNKTPLHQEYDKYIADKKAAGYFALDPKATDYTSKLAALDVAHPELDVASWKFNSVVGQSNSLNSVAAVNQALALNLPNRDVKYAGLSRPVNEDAQSTAAWKESGPRIEHFLNDALDQYKEQEAQRLYKKAYAQLTPTQQSSVASNIHTSVRTNSPQLDAWLVYWGYGGSSVTLHTQAARAYLNQIKGTYGSKPPKDNYVVTLAQGAR